MKKSALLTVFLVVLVDLMGFGIILPLLPFYAAEFHATALSVGLLYSIYSLAQLVFSPIWGAFSDRIGRRPIMLMSTLGATFSYILFGFSHSFLLLLLSRLIGGVMGGNISTAQAYVADVTTPEERAKGMGLIGAAFGIGFVAGPAIATLLLHPGFHLFLKTMGPSSLSEWAVHNKYAVPGFFAALLSFLSFLLVLMKLPETVSKKAISDSTRITRSSIFTKIFWQEIHQENLSSKKKILPILLLSIFLISFGHSNLYSAFPLFCKTILNLSANQVGFQFVFMGVITVLIQGVLIRPLVKKFGEEWLFFIGNILMILGLGLMPLAVSAKTLMLTLGLLAIGASLNGPTLNSLISKEADPSKVGAAMGTSQGLAALGRTLGPTWGGFWFGISVRAPFFMTAALLLTTLWVSLKLKK